MRYLLDTHLLLWAAKGNLGGSFATDGALPLKAREHIENLNNELYFSSASIWEVAIKSSRGKPDFMVDPGQLFHALVQNGYRELPVMAKHTIWVQQLPAIHADPFDRLLIAQAIEEHMTLMTSDGLIALYPDAPVLLVN